MKKILIVILVVACMAMCGCQPSYPSPYEIVECEDGFVISVDEASVSPTGLTVVITNDTDQDYSYGAWYRVEKKKHDNWVQVNPITYWGQNDWLDGVGANSTKSIVYEWEWYYGELKPGEYRIVLELQPGESEYRYYAAEFVIER